MGVGAKTYLGRGESELRVGDINAVSRADLPNADYYALGHIHSHQNIKGNFCYSGAPMYFDFNQKTAGVVILETKPKAGVKKLEFVELKSPAKMRELTLSGVEDVDTVLKDYSDEDIVNITFEQDEPLSMVQIKNLKNAHPCVSKVMLKLKNIEVDDKVYVSNRSKLNAGSLFVEFYKQKKLAEPSRELVGLFKELMEVDSSETN